MQWANTTLQVQVARLCGWPPKLGKPKSTYRSLSPGRTTTLVRLRGSPLKDASTVSWSGWLLAGLGRVGLGWVVGGPCTEDRSISFNYLLCH